MDELSLALCAVIEGAFTRLINLDPEARRRLTAMQGKVIAVRLRDIDLALYILPTDRGVQVYPRYSDPADTEITGTPLGLLNLGLGNTDALFDGEVVIEGDLELGQRFKRLLDQLDIDWEEQLSHYTGDALAHHLGRVVRGGLHWGRATLATLARDVSEYLQYESRTLPTQHEVAPYLAAVDRLRDGVARLEARVARVRATIGLEEAP